MPATTIRFQQPVPGPAKSQRRQSVEMQVAGTANRSFGARSTLLLTVLAFLAGAIIALAALAAANLVPSRPPAPAVPGTAAGAPGVSLVAHDRDEQGFIVPAADNTLVGHNRSEEGLGH
jgi:hypothetical protein